MPIISSFSNKAFGGSRILLNNAALRPQYTPSVDYILVAGGGAGGTVGGGGGGAGGILIGSVSVTQGTVLTVQIGGGGGGACPDSSASRTCDLHRGIPTDWR